MSTVVTGEAVALDLRHAGLPSRMLAATLDVLLQVVLLVAVTAPTTALSEGLDGAAAAAIGVLVFVLVVIGYPVAFETVMRGRTPGKAAMGLRVVRDDSGPIGFRQALVRGLTGGLLEKPGITLFSAAVLSIIFSPRSKRLGDVLAGTVVVGERVKLAAAPPLPMPPALTGWAAAADLSGLPDALLQRARDVLGRAPQLSPASRDRLLGETAAAVAARVAPPPPPGAPAWAVLAAVLAERRRRAAPPATWAPVPSPGGWPGHAGASGPVHPPPAAPARAQPDPAPARAQPDDGDGFAPVV